MRATTRTKRIKLTESEAELVLAFRAERNIYNSALEDCIKAISPWTQETDGAENLVIKAIMGLRKQ